MQVLDDNFASGLQRDTGPQITKWDQLALAPELLRSLSKFGWVFIPRFGSRVLRALQRGTPE